MYQSFEAISETGAIAGRVGELRKLLQTEKLDAMLIPHGDEHRNEYIPPSAERLRWITGFTGSAGSAVIGLEKAALFVDGRYTLQAKVQAPEELFEICPIPGPTPAEWIVKALTGDAIKVGFDPWLHAPAEIDRIEETFARRGIALIALTANLIDTIWGAERPSPPRKPVVVHPLAYAGVSARDKIAALQKELVSAGQDATILTAPDTICWLLNIRGSDVVHSPVVLCFAILHARGKPELFIDETKLDAAVHAHLKPITSISGNDKTFATRLEELAGQNKVIRIDRESCPVWIAQKLGTGKNIVHGTDICLLPKAVKNDTEINGARAAHLRDGIAMCRFLAWLDRTAPAGEIDEISAAMQLESFRRDTGELQDISFDTISGSGPNGAIVHYRVTIASNRKLGQGELYLVDSGGQYLDGTTDITRTVAIATPTQEMCDRFTRVLKGHIAVATLSFPEGTRGVDIDPFARRALWEAGLDFDHGTGHGVGSYLSVHEGPQSISRRGMAALKPGMLVSNEPGYYERGTFGIRIENLALVKAAEKITGAARTIARPMMIFETLTLAPIDCRLILVEMLTPEERTWLNAYHDNVFQKVSPHLAPDDKAWLATACALL